MVSIVDILRPHADDFRGMLAQEKDIHAAAIAHLGQDLVSDDITHKIDENLEAVLPHINDALTLTKFLMVSVAVRNVTKGHEAALTYLVDQLCNPDLLKISPDQVSAILRQYQYLNGIDAAQLARITAKHGPNTAESDNFAAWSTLRILESFGMGRSTDVTWLRTMLDTLAVPWMLQALARDYYDCAIAIENHLYYAWIRQTETLVNYNDTYGRWAEAMQQAGKRFAEKLPPLAPAKTARPVIGIFIHASTWLAHVALLHQTLSATPSRDYDIHLYVLQKRDDEISQKFADIGVKVIFIEDTYQGPPSSPSAQMAHLRVLAAQDGVHVMIWLCLGIYLNFAFGMGLAPRQVYWSMKMMINAFTAADGYWMSWNAPGHDAMHFEGRDWNIVPVTFQPNTQPTADALEKLRAQIGADKIILATFAREEKLASADFIETICDVLDQNENAIYVYTGRYDHPVLRNRFKKRGLNDRAKFLGWVDTSLYAHVIDIYLDCWPARSGVTLFHALEAKKPIVMFMGDHSNHDLIRRSFLFLRLSGDDSVYSLENPALDADYTLPNGERALLAFDTQEEYLSTVARLINDPEYRAVCGHAGRTLYNHLIDKDEAGRKIDRMLREALNKAREVMHEAA